MSKKICIFAAQYLPSIGGVEQYTYNIAKTLSSRGIEVTIVTSDIYGAPTYESVNNINIYRVPSIGCMNNRFPIIKPNKEFRSILKVIFSSCYDLVIVNTRFYPLSLIGAYMGRKYSRKCICIEHGTKHLSVHSFWLDILENVFEHSITILVKHYIKDFYGVSEACNEWLRHFHIVAKSTLYNAVDICAIEKIVKEPVYDIKLKYHLPQEGILIAFIGRILKEKGIFQLVRVMKRLKLDYPEAVLVIAGNGPELDSVSKIAGDNVYILGKIDYEEVITLLSQTAIFCLPSDSEGMPTSVLEAIACKNFVITTERGGAKEVLLDSGYGIILEKNEENSVYAALKEALDNPEYRRNAVEKSYRRLCETFTWNKVVDQIETLI